MKKYLPRLSAAMLLLASVASPALAQIDTSFIYQGKLEVSGVGRDGTADFQFRLFNSPGGSTQIGVTQTSSNVSLDDGVFTLPIDFGPGTFESQDRYLEIAVRSPAGTGNFVILNPRQRLSPTPYALKVPGIDGHSLDARDGSPSDVVFVDTAGNVGIGTTSPSERFEVRSGNGSYWRIDRINGDLHGNGGTDGVLGIYNDTTGTAARSEIIVNGQPHLVVNGGGGVGIGTTAPARRFSVLDGGIFTARFENTHPIASVVEFNNNSTNATWELGVAGTDVPHGIVHGGMYFNKQGELGVAMVMAPNQWIGMGVNDPGFRLDLPNIANPDGRGRANRWDTYSSSRWKDNVKTIDGALDKVMQLRGVSFDWKPEHGGTHELGFVAEEVGGVVPELVTWEADGKWAKGLAYDRVTALTVEAIKEQQRQIEELKQQVADLTFRLAANAEPTSQPTAK